MTPAHALCEELAPVWRGTPHHNGQRHCNGCGLTSDSTSARANLTAHGHRHDPTCPIRAALHASGLPDYLTDRPRGA